MWPSEEQQQDLSLKQSEISKFQDNSDNLEETLLDNLYLDLAKVGGEENIPLPAEDEENVEEKKADGEKESEEKNHGAQENLPSTAEVVCEEKSEIEEQEKLNIILQQEKKVKDDDDVIKSESSTEKTSVDFILEEEIVVKNKEEQMAEAKESSSDDIIAAKEFSLTLNPDLPKIRAQQIKNWLEFEKENEKTSSEEKPRSVDSGNESPRSRENSPQDFDLDSLVYSNVNAKIEPDEINNNGQHTVLTDSNGLQRKVRFLTDQNGQILLSVFLTNSEGEEEEQQQIIQVADIGKDHHLPEGIINFPEIESQLAAYVQTQQREAVKHSKSDLVDTDTILKELGVEKDENLDNNYCEESKLNKALEQDKLNEKQLKIIPVDKTILEDVVEDSCSDSSETISTSSCSSMIEIKPKESEIVIDENNNEAPNLNVKQEINKNSETEIKETVEQMKLPFEVEQFKPKLIDVEMKIPKAPNPPPSPQTAANDNDSKIIIVEKQDENRVSIQVACETKNNQEDVTAIEEIYQISDAEEQFESLCIVEEPISSVNVTIAKWESFSKKQQQQAESGESRINMAMKGLGKLILPTYNANCQQSAPIKMGGFNLGAQKKSSSKGIEERQLRNNIANSHKLWSTNNSSNNNGIKTFHETNNNNNKTTSVSLPSAAAVEEEESIYAQPSNTQSGSFTITTSLSNPSSILKQYPKPNSRGDIVNWFKEGEIHRSGILLSYYGQAVTNPIIVSWFFGLITRQQAEDLLHDQPDGTFLVRISTRIWGYTLSYQINGKTKHFLISAINPAVPASLTASFTSQNVPVTGKQQLLFPFSPGGKYAFIGMNTTPYTTLTSLIRHHSHAPITKAGAELLLNPCPGGPKIAGIEYVFK